MTYLINVKDVGIRPPACWPGGTHLPMPPVFTGSHRLANGILGDAQQERDGSSGIEHVELIDMELQVRVWIALGGLQAVTVAPGGVCPRTVCWLPTARRGVAVIR